ncbi:hypothetical protein SAMN06264849_1208 [Melghirimyces algeriensis]|uniref:Uncharacterized protein n=1 Tax=Melghirimyces algeriensis TaxID=910412 RepID=A0A521FHC7_9BACL|nr:hypothetical protein SAMN06264849_1208 [Melghirimyces algeriensis]
MQTVYTRFVDMVFVGGVIILGGKVNGKEETIKAWLTSQPKRKGCCYRRTHLFSRSGKMSSQVTRFRSECEGLFLEWKVNLFVHWRQGYEMSETCGIILEFIILGHIYSLHKASLMVDLT